MDQIELQVSSRDLVGKRVRHLRKEGALPANLFGHGVASKSLKVDTAAFRAAYAKAGTNTLIALKIDEAKDPIMALIRGIQRDAVSTQILHADFYQVSMTEKIRLSVPLSFIGAAPGAVTMGGILLHNIETVEVECLPGDLVHSITVDVSVLTDIGSSLLIKDLKVGKAVTLLADPEEMVVKVIAPAKEEEVAPVVEAAPEVEVLAPKKEKEEGEAS